jgi:hypothetical protein
MILRQAARSVGNSSSELHRHYPNSYIAKRNNYAPNSHALATDRLRVTFANIGPGVATETRSWSPSNASAGIGGIDAVFAQVPRPDLKPCALEHRLKQPRER